MPLAMLAKAVKPLSEGAAVGGIGSQAQPVFRPVRGSDLQSGAGQFGQLGHVGRRERARGRRRDDLRPQVLFLQSIEQDAVVFAVQQQIGPEGGGPLGPGQWRDRIGARYKAAPKQACRVRVRHEQGFAGAE